MHHADLPILPIERLRQQIRIRFPLPSAPFCNTHEHREHHKHSENREDSEHQEIFKSVENRGLQDVTNIQNKQLRIRVTILCNNRLFLMW